MTQRSRVFLLLAVNTILLCGLVLVIIPERNPQQLVALGVAMMLMLVVPNLIINRALSSMRNELQEATDELEATREELTQTSDRLSLVTNLDELTGCYNEAYFHDAVTRHRGMAERGSYYFTLAVLQVDQYTDLVDKHGPGSGDEVLLLFSSIVKAALREVDVVARLGSDTFGLLLFASTEDDAILAIDRISQLVSQIQVADDAEFKISISGGITSFHGTESSDDLIENARKALGFAIEQGRDRVAGFLYQPPVLGEEFISEAAQQNQEEDDAPV